MPADPIKGYKATVTLGPTNKVLGVAEFTISGATRKTQDISEFGDETDRFGTLSLDPGTVSLSNVLFDPTDPYQEQLRAAFSANTALGPGDIRIWDSLNSYWTIGIGGQLLITNAGKIDGKRSDFHKTSFDFKASGAPMVRIAGTLDAPTITITTSTSTTTAATLALVGTATVDPDAEIVSITWNNDDGTSGVATGTTAWTATAVLSMGSNTLMLTVLDSNGGTATDSLVVTRS